MKGLKAEEGQNHGPHLLHLPELLFSGLIPLRSMVPPVAQLPPRGTGRRQHFSTVDSTSNKPVDTVHGPDVKHGTRKGKMGPAGHTRSAWAAREGGGSSPGLAHTPIAGWIILGREPRLRCTHLFKSFLHMPLWVSHLKLSSAKMELQFRM